MKLECFSVFDEKASAFLPPFFLPRVAVAVRTFKNCVDDPQHAFGRNPGDYTLFHLGVFDDATGVFELKDRTVVANGVEVKDAN